MHGNVWERVQDWYGSYPSGAVTDPEGPSSGSDRVVRGGSWFSSAGYCRSAYRYVSSPVSDFYNLGFRLLSTGVQQHPDTLRRTGPSNPLSRSGFPHPAFAQDRTGTIVSGLVGEIV